MFIKYCYVVIIMSVCLLLSLPIFDKIIHKEEDKKKKDGHKSDSNNKDYKLFPEEENALMRLGCMRLWPKNNNNKEEENIVN